MPKITYKPTIKVPFTTTKNTVLINVPPGDVKEVFKNFKNLQPIVMYRVTSLVTRIVADVLSKSLPRTPYDTGKLRKSARGRVHAYGKKRFNRIVAWGTKDGQVEVDTSKIGIKDTLDTTYIVGEVSYNRLSENGARDIALWTHENIYPFESRPKSPAARMPGTGPKYLEIPFKQNEKIYAAAISNAINQLPSYVNRFIKYRSKTVGGRYLVGNPKIALKNITDRGYFYAPVAKK
jgi:hypothetical protein